MCGLLLYYVFISSLHSPYAHEDGESKVRIYTLFKKKVRLVIRYVIALFVCWLPLMTLYWNKKADGNGCPIIATEFYDRICDRVELQ